MKNISTDSLQCMVAFLLAGSTLLMMLKMGKEGECQKFLESLEADTINEYNLIIAKRAKNAFWGAMAGIIMASVATNYMQEEGPCTYLFIALFTMTVTYQMLPKPDLFVSHLTPDEVKGYEACGRQASNTYMKGSLMGLAVYFGLSYYGKLPMPNLTR